MGAVGDREQLIRAIVRLRRAELEGAPEEVGDVREDIERIVGRTVGRAMSARILGISQTALDRHVRAGDVPAVTTPAGRRELPLSELVRLAIEVDDARRSGAGEHPLASVLSSRRDRARRLMRHTVAAGHGSPADPHRLAALRGLGIHRAIASRLDEQTITDARRRLRRWRQEGRIDERWAREWEQVLARPIREIREIITADDQAATDLRQSSPFAGVLTPAEHRRVVELVGGPA
ncbi:MAG: hypothetical protein AB1416_04310 [Actinomycetota bacterium]